MNDTDITDLMASPPVSPVGQPAWEVALLFPQQGDWTEAEYLALETRSNQLVELVDGRIEVLPMPSYYHQMLVDAVQFALRGFVNKHGLGKVLGAPLPIRLGNKNYREPDVMFFKPGRVKDKMKQPEGADLVIEVLSPGNENRERDSITKRREYASGGISEYWIVDPEKKEILVLTLDGAAYRDHGLFGAGQTASSLLLQGFTLSVDELFAVE